MQDDPIQIALHEIANSLSHDFRAPLRRVQQFVALIEKKHGAEFDAETAMWLGFINENTHRMQFMIECLAELNSVTCYQGDSQAVELPPLIEKILVNLKGLISETSASIVVADDLPRLEAIPELLSLLLHKLIEYALRQGTESDQKLIINLDLKLEGKQAILNIRDNGPGIAAELLPNVFDLFNESQQADAKRSQDVSLAVCRHIAARLGTNLEVTSTLGVGSKFFFKLPLA
jgi:light-regulated signal transduction histidine kinase (bacteriophytochrome)